MSFFSCVVATFLWVVSFIIISYFKWIYVQFKCDNAHRRSWKWLFALKEKKIKQTPPIHYAMGCKQNNNKTKREIKQQLGPHLVSFCCANKPITPGSFWQPIFSWDHHHKFPFPLELRELFHKLYRRWSWNCVTILQQPSHISRIFRWGEDHLLTT